MQPSPDAAPGNPAKAPTNGRLQIFWNQSAQAQLPLPEGGVRGEMREFMVISAFAAAVAALIFFVVVGA